MNAKEIIGVAVGCMTLIGSGYGLALAGGFIVDEARAGEIASAAVAKEEAQRLEFVRQTKFDRLRFINRLSEKSPDDQLEMDSLRKEIDAIDARLAELRGAP